MITLFHGSNMEIDAIDLKCCYLNKDFGQGFYLTDISEQAEYMALCRTRIVGEGVPTVTTYSFNEECLHDGTLKVKIIDLDTGLYYQSAAYNYGLLKHEIAYGKIA